MNFFVLASLPEPRSQIRKLSWVRVLVKILALGLISSCDLRYVSYDQIYGKLSGINDWQKACEFVKFTCINTAGLLLVH
jgi:hypothetical protein